MFLGTKTIHLPHIFDIIRILQKTQNNHFYPFINACHQIQFQKNLIKRLRVKIKNVKLGPRNDPFTLF